MPENCKAGCQHYLIYWAHLLCLPSKTLSIRLPHSFHPRPCCLCSRAVGESFNLIWTLPWRTCLPPHSQADPSNWGWVLPWLPSELLLISHGVLNKIIGIRTNKFSQDLDCFYPLIWLHLYFFRSIRHIVYVNFAQSQYPSIEDLQVLLLLSTKLFWLMCTVFCPSFC